jgi:hypothetical protein
MASISMMKMLIKTGQTGLAALVITGAMGASALQAQTPAPSGAEEDVRWVLPPPPRSLTTPAPVAPAAPPPIISAPARTETPNPFGGAPVMQQAAPAALEPPSFLAPPSALPAAMQPPAPLQAAPMPAVQAAPAAAIVETPQPLQAAPTATRLETPPSKAHRGPGLTSRSSAKTGPAPAAASRAKKSSG